MKTLSLVACALLFPRFAGATEWHNFGARSMGMGGAAVALPNGAESAYWNPAALGAPENKSGLQIPVGLHLGLTGKVLKAANDLDKIQDDCQTLGANQGTCTQGNIDTALNEFNAPGSGLRADVGAGGGLKIGRLAIFAYNFTYIGAKPRAVFGATTANIGTNQSELLIRGISGTEAGAAYGRELPFAPGLFLGGAAKLIAGKVGFDRIRIANEDVALDDFRDNARSSVRPAFDLGAYWDAQRTFENIKLHPRLGLTARNLNNPSFKNPSAAVLAGAPANRKLNGNLRMGAAISPFEFWNIAADLDLTRNLTELEGLASQNMGVGTEINVFNRSWINIPLRAGFSRNLADPEARTALSVGAGLNFLHFNIDLGVTSSPRTQEVQSKGESKKYPNDVSAGLQIAFLFGGSGPVKKDAAGAETK